MWELVWLTLINLDDLIGCTVIHQQWDTQSALLAGSLRDISIWTENLQFQLSACELSTRSKRELNHIKCFCWRDARKAVDFGISESRKQPEGIPHQSWCLGPCWWATWGSHTDPRHRVCPIVNSSSPAWQFLWLSSLRAMSREIALWTTGWLNP